MGVIVGIDPGMSGAVVVVSGQRLVEVYDMPVDEVNGRNCLSPARLSAMLSQVRDELTIDMVIVEHVQGVQQSGATSAFAFGRGFGTIEGVVAALSLPMTLVRPQRWTKALGVGRDKGAHRAAASRLWPLDAKLFARVKDDGRADAALLCEWYRRSGVTSQSQADEILEGIEK